MFGIIHLDNESIIVIMQMNDTEQQNFSDLADMIEARKAVKRRRAVIHAEIIIGRYI